MRLVLGGVGHRGRVRWSRASRLRCRRRGLGVGTGLVVRLVVRRNCTQPHLLPLGLRPAEGSADLVVLQGGKPRSWGRWRVVVIAAAAVERGNCFDAAVEEVEGVGAAAGVDPEEVHRRCSFVVLLAEFVRVFEIGNAVGIAVVAAVAGAFVGGVAVGVVVAVEMCFAVVIWAGLEDDLVVRLRELDTGYPLLGQGDRLGKMMLEVREVGLQDRRTGAV